MSARLSWRLHAVDRGLPVYLGGMAFGTFKQARKFADRHHWTESCRIEHARNGELWHRRGGSWIKERAANDPDWLAWRQRQELRSREADGRPTPSS